MQRIHVTGNAGSGKTTLGKAISKKLGIDLHGLDQIVWKSGWVKTPLDERKEKIQKLIENKQWIIEGVSSQVFKSADFIIFLDLPLWKCLLSIIKRFFQTGLKTRSDLPKNCPEYIGVLKALRIAFIYQRKTRLQLHKLSKQLTSNQKIIFVKARNDCEKVLASIS
jgi:adenylate kinase family enzyme